MALSRPARSAAGAEAAGKPQEDPTFKTFPRIWEHMTEGKYDDGASRQLSALSVFCEDGRVKVALNDREERRSLYVAGDTLRDALKALETALGDAGSDWRAWGKGTKKK